MMNVAITVDPEISVPPVLYGGIERIVYMLLCGLLDEGHEVTLFAHPESKVKSKLISWGGLDSTNRIDTIKNSISLSRKAIKERYDVIHSFSRLAYLLPLLPLRIPKIMSYQREPSLAQIAKSVYLAKKGSLLFTGCSDYITNQIKHVAEARTIYNCVHIENYTAVYTISNDSPLIFLGRIEAIKGVHMAIDIAKLARKRLIIAGNIPVNSLAYFKEKIQPELNENISFVGPVDDKMKNELLGNCCCLLMPILWNEPFGIVMIEAMACGTPVIGFPYGSVPEVVEDGVNGFICHDINDVVEKIADLDKIDRAKVRSITENKFRDTVIVKNYLNAYDYVRFAK